MDFEVIQAFGGWHWLTEGYFEHVNLRLAINTDFLVNVSLADILSTSTCAAVVPNVLHGRQYVLPTVPGFSTSVVDLPIAISNWAAGQNLKV